MQFHMNCEGESIFPKGIKHDYKIELIDIANIVCDAYHIFRNELCFSWF